MHKKTLSSSPSRARTQTQWEIQSQELDQNIYIFKHTSANDLNKNKRKQERKGCLRLIVVNFRVEWYSQILRPPTSFYLNLCNFCTG